MIDIKKLRQLVKLMADNSLTELDLEGEGEKVRLRRQDAAGPAQAQYVPAPPAAPNFAPPPPPAAPPAPEPAQQAGGGTAIGGVEIRSPKVGTYYAASSPDAPPLVNVGDRVEPDTVVCIIEAMKVFNEIKAEVAGTVQRVLVDNGQAVEFEQALFEVKPD